MQLTIAKLRLRFEKASTTDHKHIAVLNRPVRLSLVLRLHMLPVLLEGCFRAIEQYHGIRRRAAHGSSWLDNRWLRTVRIMHRPGVVRIRSIARKGCVQNIGQR